jgi:hypothetical protein
MITAGRDIRPSTLEGQTFEGIVVNNDDSSHEDQKKLGRIQIRVAGFFDGFADEDLPWCIYETNESLDGSSPTSGKFNVPAIGARVNVKFQKGSVYHPTWTHSHGTEKDIPEEALTNYPKRAVSKLSNGCLVVVDRETNEIFIRNPGNANIYIQGDVSITVSGAAHHQIKGDYILEVDGNYIEKVKGNHQVSIDGSESGSVNGSRHWNIGGSDTSS